MKSLRSARLLASLLLFWLGTSTAFAAHHHLSPELNERVARAETDSENQKADAQFVDVIIQFKPGAQLDDHIARLVNAGGKHKNRLDLINGGLFRVPASLLSTLAEDPDVAYISPDREIKKHSKLDFIMDATDTTSIINLGYDGDGIGVAVIDSGVNSSHPDLQDTGRNGTYARVVYSQSFVTGLDASDQYGHGTHVAGLIAGNGNVSGNWMIGMASEVSIINLRVLDANGAGTDSAVIAAIQRAIQLKNQYNIRVINLSLGRGIAESYKQDPLCQAVEQAWKAGIVVVVAAGNDGQDNSMNTNGYATITAPGNDPYVITVGAFNTRGTDQTSDDVMTSYSSKGPSLLDHVIKPDLVAPGNKIVSLLANGSTLDKKAPSNEVSPSLYNSRATKASYFTLSGTSMSAAIVSGAVALMLQYQSNLSPDQVKARLMKNASKTYPSYSTVTSNGTKYNIQYDIFTVGAGYLDTDDAMESNDFPSGTALSPIAVRDANGNVLLQADPSSIWSNSVIWEDSIVWGNSVLLSGSSIIWGDSVVWGNSTMSGNSIIWDDSIIWGTSTTFSEAFNSDDN